MGGLKNLFLKLTPIMFLICCICYGIMHTFTTNPNKPITYLTQEQINIGTEENPEYKTLYQFDMVSYTQNINQNILKRSIEHTISLDAYESTLNKFNTLWKNGYNVGDVTKTILNGVILIINTLILPVNILLVPLRIISGLILTGLSLIGINIDNGSIIIPVLTFIVDKLAIPFINQTTDNNESWGLYVWNNSQWIWNEEMTNLTNGEKTEKQFLTGQYLEKTYYGIKVQNNNMYYLNAYNNWEAIYINGQWLDESYRNIYFPLKTFTNDADAEPISTWLARNAEYIAEL